MENPGCRDMSDQTTWCYVDVAHSEFAYFRSQYPLCRPQNGRCVDGHASSVLSTLNSVQQGRKTETTTTIIIILTNYNLTRFHLLNLLIYHTIQVVRFYSCEKSSDRPKETLNSASLIFGSFMINIHTTPDTQSSWSLNLGSMAFCGFEL